jgi:hypothetical protein
MGNFFAKVVNFCLYSAYLLFSAAEIRHATFAHSAAGAEHSECHDNRRTEDGASTQLHNIFFNQRHGPTLTGILVSTLLTYRENV